MSWLFSRVLVEEYLGENFSDGEQCAPLMPAYYNEIDPYAAQWLRNLIARGAGSGLGAAT